MTRETFGANFGSQFRYDFYSDGSLGLEKGELARYIHVSPNPTTDPVTIDMNGLANMPVACEVVNAMGQTVANYNWIMTGEVKNRNY